MKVERTCVICKEIFLGSSHAKFCKKPDCQREKKRLESQRYYHKNKLEVNKRRSAFYYPRVKEKLKAKQRSLKLKALQKISNLEHPLCSKCSCDNLDILEIAHINHDGQIEENRSHLIFLVATGKRPPKGLKVLCKICNQIEDVEHRFNEYGFSLHWEPTPTRRQK